MLVFPGSFIFDVYGTFGTYYFGVELDWLICFVAAALARIDVEMQNKKEVNFDERALYYA